MFHTHQFFHFKISCSNVAEKLCQKSFVNKDKKKIIQTNTSIILFSTESQVSIAFS